MGKPFTTNIDRFDPYKTYRFLVYFGKSTTPVAAVSKVSALKRSSDVIEYKEGGDPIILKGLGRTKYEPITMERGVTFDSDFEEWANAAQLLTNGSPSTSLASLRKEVAIVLLNEEAQPVHRYVVRPSPLRMIGAPPSLYSITSDERFSALTVLTAATGVVLVPK